MAQKQQPAAPAKGQPSALSDYEKAQPSESPKQPEELRIVQSGDVDSLWTAADPNAKAQALFMNYLHQESEARKQDLNKWDDCETRFEPNELQWIANFIVNNLIFCKQTLKSEDESVCSQVSQLLWEVLDIFGRQGNLQNHTSDRYRHLQSGLKRMFEEKLLTAAQIQQVLEYARVDIFGHLQLYMACIGMKKQQVRVKSINIIQEMPQLCESPNLNTDCREITAEQPKEENPMTAEKQEEQVEEQADPEEIVDPDDPLYGLDQRLKDMALDDESKRIVIEKLKEASDKIKVGLEQRQANLDAKINAAPPKKGK